MTLDASSDHSPRPALRERSMYAASGWLALLVGLVIAAFGVWRGFLEVTRYFGDPAEARQWQVSSLAVAAVALAAGWFVLSGLFTLQPNQSVVLTFVGAYRGTVKADGLRWTLPVYRRQVVSLRLNNHDGGVLKVNDRDGSPIEISAVIVWRVGDTARAVFEVQDYRSFVVTQSEAAVRELAQTHAYDSVDDQTHSLRGGGPALNEQLRALVEARLDDGGVQVLEARVNHLAYAPEIAGAMLRRQQAQAVIEARTRIVDGAVDIAQGAIQRVRAQNGINLSPDDELQLMSRLLTVLCSESHTVPTLDLGARA